MRFLFTLLLFLLSLRGQAQYPSLQWARQFSGTSYGRAIVLDDSNNIYAAGTFYGTVDFDPGPGSYSLSATGEDIFITKLDSNGNFVWAKQIGGGGNQACYKMIRDAAGNLLLTGSFSGNTDFDPGPGMNVLSALVRDAFACKLDPAGGLLWARQFRCTGDNLGMDGAQGLDISTDLRGNVYNVGTFVDSIDLDPAPGTLMESSDNISIQGFITVLDSTGNFRWGHVFGNSRGFLCDAVAVDGAGGVFITGLFSDRIDFDPGPGVAGDSATSSNMYLLKLDSLGNFSWVRQFAGSPRSVAWPAALSIDYQHNLIINGLLIDTFDFDPGPAVENRYGDSTYRDFDLFLLKLDPAGGFKWAGVLGGKLDDYAGVSLPDQQGNIYLTGSFYDTADLDPGPNVRLVTAPATYNGFICKLDSAGLLTWVRQLGGPGAYGDVAGIALDASDQVYGTGSFSATCDFNYPNTPYLLTATAQYNTHLFKFDQSSLQIRPFSRETGIRVYPNPVEKTLTVATPQSLQHASITVFGLNSQILYQERDQSGRQFQLDVSALPAGMYFVELSAAGTRHTGRFVKQ